MRRRLHLIALRLYRMLPRLGRRWLVRAIAPKYTAGTMCFVERDDGALLLLRQVYRDRWGVPGGLLTRREVPADGALREALEEIGVEIELLGEPAVVVEPSMQRIDIIYRAKITDPNAVPKATSPEIAEVRWFPRDRLPELQHETTGALVAMARMSKDPGSPTLTSLARLRPVSGDASGLA